MTEVLSDITCPDPGQPFYGQDAQYSSNAPSFKINTDELAGTITDDNTTLMWQQSSASWENALAYCEGLNLSGYDDWRLPNIRELISIVDHSAESPAINSTIFPGTEYGASIGYWSSTTNNGYIGNANYVNFEYGSARCVRGGL